MISSIKTAISLSSQVLTIARGQGAVTLSGQERTRQTAGHTPTHPGVLTTGLMIVLSVLKLGVVSLEEAIRGSQTI